MLNDDENRLLELLEKNNTSRITFGVVKRSEVASRDAVSDSALYSEFIHNLDYKISMENNEAAEDDSDNFQDGKLQPEDSEIPNVVPVKEILDLFEEEYLFRLKDHGIMDRLRKRMESIQESAEYFYSITHRYGFGEKEEERLWNHIDQLKDFNQSPPSQITTNENRASLNSDRAVRFYNFEDSLLLLGLKKYGLGSWEAIQSNILPSKTSKQIQNRYKNLSCRRAPNNPIKVRVRI